MNEIRKNLENEEILVEGTFRISLGAILILIFGLLILVGPFIGFLLGFIFAPGGIELFPFMIIFGLMSLFFIVAQILKLAAIKKNKLVITNKRIYGAYAIVLAKKDFSYRLDEIDNVEMVSSFGYHILAVQFTQGHGPTFMPKMYVNGIPTSSGDGVLRIYYLKNHEEIMKTLNDLIVSRKNLVDVQTDIEMSKLDAENRKADALENVAKSISGNEASTKSKKSATSYIDELRELKKLCDEGIITQEEFEQEKSEILNNNHK